ncbi:Serine/threonine-protein kinase plk1 [Perkinsus chesapeaki]|uniref:Serine/threonine-protein kinase PLK n=1 Tax=Perkinsus chesapeaki TaxID=330153 RepID=A0A7J6MJD8_PERCH|nr:Serine/threonine-protein kinase plk1 [Perkinsus chesapeaki]
MSRNLLPPPPPAAYSGVPSSTEQHHHHHLLQQQAAAAAVQYNSTQGNSSHHTTAGGEVEILEDRKGRRNGGIPVYYEKGRFLGKGGFAKVYEYTEQKTGQKVAIKAVQKASLTKQKAKAKLQSEIAIHRSLKHPRIVRYLSHFEDSNCVYIVMELCAHATLNEIHKRQKRFTEQEARHYIWQLCDGVKYLHQNRVIHRDLKLGNLFLKDSTDLKIGDLGLAAKLDYDGDRKTTVCGTPNYIAPEILEGAHHKYKGHSYEVDIWSIGVILYTMLCGRPPFEDQDVKATYKRIRHCQYKFPDAVSISNEAKCLIQSMLQIEPTLRPTLDQIMSSTWMVGKTPAPQVMSSNPMHYITAGTNSGGGGGGSHYSQGGGGANGPASSSTLAQPSARTPYFYNPPPAPASLLTQRCASPRPGHLLSGAASRACTPDRMLNPDIARIDSPQISTRSGTISANRGMCLSREPSPSASSACRTQFAGLRSPSPASHPTRPGVQGGSANTSGRPPHPHSALRRTPQSVAALGGASSPGTSSRSIPGHMRQGSTTTTTATSSRQPMPPRAPTGDRLAVTGSPTCPDREGLTSPPTTGSKNKDGFVRQASPLLRTRNVHDSQPVNISTPQASYSSPSGTSTSGHLVRGATGRVLGRENGPLPPVWITKWCNFTSKYGIGFLLSSGNMGVYFNDSTQMITLDPPTDKASPRLLVEYRYRSGSNTERMETLPMDGQGSQVDSENRPEKGPGSARDVKKKLTLMKQFKNYLLQDDAKREGVTFGHTRIVPDATTTGGGPPSVEASGGVCHEVVGIRKFLDTKHGILFSLTDKIVQLSFYDGSELVLSPKTGSFVYVCRKTGRRYTFSLSRLPELTDLGARDQLAHDVVKRVRFTKEILSHSHSSHGSVTQSR